MRFFKYLVFIFLTFLSTQSFALIVKGNPFDRGYVEVGSYSEYCNIGLSRLKQSFPDPNGYNGTPVTSSGYTVSGTSLKCTYNPVGWVATGQIFDSCPTGQQKDIKWWVDIPMPASACISKCVYISDPAVSQSCVDVDIEGVTGVGECGPMVSTGAKCDQPDPDPRTQPKPPLRPDECKNATGSDSYCDKPPDRGCPSGYKQAMFNNKQICVKDSPTDPNPNDPNNGPDDPDGPDDPNNPPNPNGCTNGDPYCDKPPDNSCPVGYYQARYQGKDICVKNNPNNNGPNPNDPNNPPPDGNGDGDNGGGDGGPFCDGAGKLICDAVTDIKDSLNEIFSDEGKEEIEQLGEQSTDSRLTAAETEMTSKLQSFANALSYSSSHACISDLTVTNIPHFGSMTVPLSKWCDLLALVKLMLKLAVLMLALRMIDATVRAF